MIRHLSSFWLRIAAVAAVPLLVIAVLPLQICTDRAFVDETTGSRQGFREWFFGARSGYWYKESGLETFLRSNNFSSIQQRWTSYAGTGRNVFGGRVSFGHGSPGAILMLSPDVITEYCRQVSDAEKRRLHNIWLSDDQTRIRETVGEVFDVLWKNETVKTEADAPSQGISLK